eukprot:47202-Pelagomonas_calceolata.AAC.3
MAAEHAWDGPGLCSPYRDVSASAVAATAKGCVWNQDVPALLKAAGLQPIKLERYTAGTIMMVEAQRKHMRPAELHRCTAGTFVMMEAQIKSVGHIVFSFNPLRHAP